MKSKSSCGVRGPKRCRSGGGPFLSPCVQGHPAFLLTLLIALVIGCCDFKMGELPPIELFLGKCSLLLNHGVTFRNIAHAGLFEHSHLGCDLQQLVFSFPSAVKKGLQTVLTYMSGVVMRFIRWMTCSMLLSLQLHIFFILQPFLIGMLCVVILLMCTRVIWVIHGGEGSYVIYHSKGLKGTRYDNQWPCYLVFELVG